MNEILFASGRRLNGAGKNGRANGKTNGAGPTNGRRTTGQPTLSSKPAPVDPPRRLTALLVSLARQLFAVDDLVADLPLRQLRVCVILHEGPLSMSVLSRELGVSLSAMTQIADRLERARLVRRTFEGTDRRVRSLQLTARGQRIMRLRENARAQRAATVLRQMSAKQQAEIVASLESLLEACSAAKI